MLGRNFHINGVWALDFALLGEEDIYQIYSMRHHESNLCQMYSSFSLQEHLAFVASLGRDRTRRFFLMKEDGVVLGVGSLDEIDGTHATIGLYKNPALNRVGDKILQTLEAIAWEHLDLHTLVLEVRESNQRAIKCYERNGFSQAGRLREFVRVYNATKYEDILIYEKIRP